jgi:hypothetical protein
MNGRRFVLGLSLFCALVCSGFAASSASAVGTTVVECQPGSGAAGFEDEHCVAGTSDKTKVKFVHKEVGVVNETKVFGTNEKTASSTTAREFAVLEFTFSKEAIAITCTEVGVGVATVSNVNGPPMSITGAGTINYRKCTVTKPAGEGCTLAKDEISAQVTAATKENTMEVEFKPEGAKPFATFEIKGCKNFLLNGKDEVTGTANAIPEGATLTTTKASTESTLKVSGQKAVLFSKITMSNELKYPLALTTL